MIINNTEITRELWNAAYEGNIGALRMYYLMGGKPGQRININGVLHSLIAGAYRNGKFETAKYLLSMGETLEGDEGDEIELDTLQDEYAVGAAEEIVEYMWEHSGDKTVSEIEEDCNYIIDYFKLDNNQKAMVDKMLEVVEYHGNL